MIRFTAIDPSLNNLGLALMEYDPIKNLLSVVKIKLVQTESLMEKKTRRNSDDLRRADELLAGIQSFEKLSDLMIAEVPVGTQSSRGAISNGICIGVLAAITKPLIQVTPAEAKKATVGRGTASKDEMIDWAVRNYPDAEWLRRKLKGKSVLVDKNEHMADAIAIGHAGILTQEFKAAVAMMLAIKANAQVSSA